LGYWHTIVTHRWFRKTRLRGRGKVSRSRYRQARRGLTGGRRRSRTASEYLSTTAFRRIRTTPRRRLPWSAPNIAGRGGGPLVSHFSMERTLFTKRFVPHPESNQRKP
jgi:hypothetical protein